MWFIMAFILSVNGDAAFMKAPGSYTTEAKCNEAAMNLPAPPHDKDTPFWLQCVKLGDSPV